DQLPEHARERGCFVEAPPEPIRVEPVQQSLEAFPGRAQHEIGRYAYLVQEDLVVIDLAGETPDRPDVHAQRAVRDHEHAEAAAATRLAARAREHESVRCDPGVTRPNLV